ncbi:MULTISPECIES: GNAT family N-acetyltransferase [Kitasatospora]|uniref:Putative acetyltransferase n=1 Tax=Kitasatospora setae (strain ATCC 33774 / DSM 43861 / JCM 3304 / KCC A-0304 / NBRC 14216 / KM-6054) TaxID=452652 RepID=E4NIP1_KITSK|nr:MULTISPECIES: GNAT family N-acetyltransferase [Kitasatospora]BAJ32839.1 putative acetyltransferase [Kitasatospora setae KM-6054]
MSEYELRAARPEDIDAVLAFWAEAAEGTSISDDRAGVARLLERDGAALILAESGGGAEGEGEGEGAILGTVIAGWDGWRCHLYRLAVHPAARRRGIGTALLDAAHARFAEAGGRRADAMVLEHNDLGQAAWRAAGYGREEQWRRWTRPLDAPAGPAA